MSRPIEIISSEIPVFDGIEAVVWLMKMTSSVVDARVKNIIPGVLYTFVFTQNEVGGHTFQWPDKCTNPPPINPEPNGYTVANFIGMTGGTMSSNIPGTWPTP